MLSTRVRARLRLAVVVIGLLPLALLARMAASGRLSEFVQRTAARAWEKHDKDAGRD